jgi:enoyl-CoA hydratase/carnithine racemase
MRIDAAEALRIGLVDRMLPDTELWNATTEITRTISGNAPLAIKAAKITIAQVRPVYNASSTALAISAVPFLPPNSIGLMPSA